MIWQIEQHGFAFIENALTRLEAEDWARTFGTASGAGRRGLLALPEVAAFARSESLLKLVRLYVGAGQAAFRVSRFRNYARNKAKSCVAPRPEMFC